MAYRIEYHERHEGEKIGSHVHVFLSGSKEERARDLAIIESKLGKSLSSIAYGIFDEGTHYKIRRIDWPWEITGQEERLIGGLSHVDDLSLTLMEYNLDLDPLDRIRIRDEIAYRNRLRGF